ncbi:unnamed protein product, partial [Polarella glacialis]
SSAALPLGRAGHSLWQRCRRDQADHDSKGASQQCLRQQCWWTWRKSPSAGYQQLASGRLQSKWEYRPDGYVIWAAHAADKTARAWLTEKQPAVTKEIMVATIKARQGEEAPAASSNAKFEREEATGDLFTD